MSATITKPAAGRPTFTLQLRPEPGVEHPILALRALLKVARRRFDLRCISAHEDNKETDDDARPNSV
jgi:hypothetical protein